MARNKLLQVRVTAEEKAELIKRAGGARKLSAYLRGVGLGGADRSETSSPQGPGGRGVDPPVRTPESSGAKMGEVHISKTWTAEEMVDPDFEAQVEKEMKKLKPMIPQSYRRRVEAERIVRERS